MLGFPVRLTLASPTLRVWDHPDLSVEGVYNAARVRETYRRLKERQPVSEQSVLGVTVADSAEHIAQLRLRIFPVRPPHLLVELGVGPLELEDSTLTCLPCNLNTLQSALGRLQGAKMFLGRVPDLRRQRTQSLLRLLEQVAQFGRDWTGYVDAMRLEPIVLRQDGRLEIREAAISVNERFANELVD